MWLQIRFNQSHLNRLDIFALIWLDKPDLRLACCNKVIKTRKSGLETARHKMLKAKWSLIWARFFGCSSLRQKYFFLLAILGVWPVFLIKTSCQIIVHHDKGTFTNNVCIFWPRTYHSLHFYCGKCSILLTTYPPLNTNVICESSLISTETHVNFWYEKIRKCHLFLFFFFFSKSIHVTSLRCSI